MGASRGDADDLNRSVGAHEAGERQRIQTALAGIGGRRGMRFAIPVLPEVDTTTLGGRLKRARLEAGLRQEDAADRPGVHVQCVSNWENGRSRPRRLSIEQVEAAIAPRRAGHA